MNAHLITLPENTDLSALDWTTVEVEEVNRGDFDLVEDPYGDLVVSDAWVAGYAVAEAESAHGKLRFSFPWIANGGTESFRVMYDFDARFDDDEQEWGNREVFPCNFVLVDEDGDTLEAETFEAIEELVERSITWEPAVEECLPSAPGPEDIDTEADTDTGDTDMEKITLTRDNDRDLAFTGELIGEASSRTASGSSSNRWTELRLYRTADGRYVAEEVGRSQWEGERTRHSATVCDDLDEVHDALGDGWLAKELYEQAGVAAEMLEDLDKDAAVLNESDDGVVLRNQLDDAVAEALIAQAEGCCGAGRHLIIFEDGEIQYLHDSARQRIGDPEKTGEARVLWETPCAAEDAWDTATGELSAEDIREGYDLEDSDFDADGDITAEARRKVCRDWGREIVSTGLADEVLFGVDSDDTRQSILAKAAGMVDNIVIETDYMINGETCMTFNVTPGDLGHPQSMDELKDAAGRWISRINLGLCGYKAVAVIVNGERIVR